MTQLGSAATESGPGESGRRQATRGSRLARRRRVLLGVGIAAALLAIGGLVGASFVKSPQQLAADTAAPPPTVTTATVVSQILTSSVQMRGEVYPATQYDVYATAPSSAGAGAGAGGGSSSGGSASAVYISKLDVAAGRRPRGGERVMGTPVIELRGLARTYPGPPPVPALRPADLVIAGGDYVAVTGPSGSGKSTLLHVLGLLDSPTQGSYLLDGLVTSMLGDRDRSALRGSRIGFVFQSFHLLPYRTALENVLLAQLYNQTPRGGRVRAAVEALDAVRLGHRLDALPTTLSGGECQRVAIARALVNRPSLLLCDEPTGNLDSRNAAALMDLLDQLNEAGFTIVVITHDAGVAAHAGRTVAISDGILSERAGVHHA